MANPVTIYGIKNCDTMAKARGWLDGRGVAYAFNDYRVDGIETRQAPGMGRQGRLGEAAQPRHRRRSALWPTRTSKG